MYMFSVSKKMHDKLIPCIKKKRKKLTNRFNIISIFVVQYVLVFTTSDIIATPHCIHS